MVSYWDDPTAVHVDLDGSDFGGTHQAVDGWGNTEMLSGIEELDGSAFDDTLRGDGNHNTFEGWKGNDIIDGGANFDNVSYWSSTSGVSVNLVTGVADDGMGGTDTLISVENVIGSLYDDTFVGGTESNFFNGRGGDDSITGGTGDADTVSYVDDPAGVYVNLATGTATDGWGDTDTFTEIEDATGSQYDDTLLGTSGENVLIGGEGDDILQGGDGNDSLSGDDGADTFRYVDLGDIQSSTTETILDFVSGTDKVQFSGTWAGETLFWYEEDNYDGVIDGGNSSNHAVVWDNAAKKLWYDYDVTVSNASEEKTVANLPGASLVMTDVIVESGTVMTSVLNGVLWTGTAGSESYDGTAGDDTLDGADGDDTINGLGGEDIVKGGAGNDVINGGDDNDLIMAYGGADTSTGVFSTDTLDGGAGDDTLTDTASVDFTGMTLSNIENIEIPDYQGFTFDHIQIHNQAWTIIGSQYTNLHVNGTAGDDTLSFASLDTSGMSGIVHVNLETGHDVFRGSAAAEDVIGGGGDDTIQGVDGDDLLIGGEGADVFVYEYGSAINLSDDTETIDDFETGVDRIWLTGDLADADIEWYMEANYDGIIDAAANDQPVLVWDPMNYKLWYDDKPQDADGAWQGVLANFNSNMVIMGDIFVEDATITEPTSGAEITTGSTGDDTLSFSSASGGTLFGYDGNDSLVGNTAAEKFIGGAGEDTINADDGQDVVSYAYDPDGVNVDLSGTIITGPHQAVDGWGDNDYLSDIEDIIGSGYNDTLFGDSGANIIQGGDGVDIIGGLGGADTLTGGIGGDTFVLHSNTMSTVTLTDFDASMDKIGLNTTAFDFFPDGFNPDNFSYLNAVDYDGTGVTFGGGETSGLIYASVGGASVGQLWYDPDTGTGGDHVLLALVTETDGDITASVFEAAASGGGSP